MSWDSVADDAAWFAKTIANAADDERSRRALGDIAHHYIKAGRHRDALRAFDAVVAFADQPLDHYCNALWVVQRDNTGLPIDEARSRRYLAACLPHAPANPPIHLNAAGVYAELGDRDAVVLQLRLAAHHRVDVKPFLDEPLLRPFTAGWSAGDPIDAPSPLYLAAERIAAGVPGEAVPALLVAWSRSRAPRIADLLDAIAARTGERDGYRAARIEQLLRDSLDEVPAFLRRHTQVQYDGRGWIVQDLDDPRVATAFVALLRDPPATRMRKRAQDAWQQVIDTLTVLGDVRAPLEALSRSGLPNLPSHLQPWLRARLAAAATALAEHPPLALSADEARLCDEMEAALGHVEAPAVSLAQPVSPSPPIEPPLATAVEALEREDVAAALPVLLAAWQRTRAPRLADVLDHVCAPVEIAIDDQDEWLDVAFADDPDEMPLLLATLIAETPAASAERIWALEHRDDPRLAAALLRTFDEPPFLAPREIGDDVIAEFWDAAMDALRELGDRRAVEPLVALAQRARTVCLSADREAEANMYTHKPVGGYLERVAREAADAIRGNDRRVPLTAEETEALEKLEARFAAAARAAAEARERARIEAARRATFLAQIAAAPDDDAPRLAYAEWLIERGDDQGEYIESRILDPRGEEKPPWEASNRWLGVLAPFVEDRRYDRGFPVDLTLSMQGREVPAELVGHPSWATVKTLRCSAHEIEYYELLPLIGHPVMRSLKQLRGLTASALVALTHEQRRPYELVGVNPVYDIKPDEWPRFLNALDHLPRLHTLVLEIGPAKYKADVIDPLLASRAGEKLACLAMTVESGSYDSGAHQWIRLYPAIARSRIPRFDLAWLRGQLAFSFTRDEAGALSRLAARYVPEHVGDLVDMLWRLPDDALTHFALASGAPPSREAVAELARALARFPRLSPPALPAPLDVAAEAPALLAKLRDESAWVAEQAAQRLIAIGADQLGEVFREQLLADDDSIRRAAVSWLSRYATADDLPALRVACRRIEARDAWLAALVLGQRGAREALDDLVALLRECKHDDGRQAALQALAMLGDPAAIPHVCAYVEPLIADLQEETRVERREAIVTLGILGAREARPLALRLLQHGDVYDKRCAVTTLGLVGEPADAALFADHLASDEPYPAGRALLAHLLLVPADLTPARSNALARALDHWRSTEWATCIPLACSARQLASVVDDASLGAAMCRMYEASANETRAQLLDRTDGASIRLYWIELCRRVEQAWSID